MAISFDEVDDWYLIADDDSLTLPNGDWCVGIWTKVDDNTGSSYQYLLSTNFEANGQFIMWIEEANTGFHGEVWKFQTIDDDGTNSTTVPSPNPTGADGLWRLVICQRNTGAAAGEEFELWYCEPGQTATLEATRSDVNFAISNGGVWNVGRRTDGNADRYYGSSACEFFKGNFALTLAEITQLGRGLRIYDLGHIPSAYLEMFSADATLHDVFGPNNATRQSAPTTVDHAPVRSPKLPVGLL